MGGPNKKPRNCKILDNWSVKNFTLADEPFAKSLQTFENFALVKNNLHGKLVSPLEFSIKFNEIFNPNWVGVNFTPC